MLLTKHYPFFIEPGLANQYRVPIAPPVIIDMKLQVMSFLISGTLSIPSTSGYPDATPVVASESVSVKVS